MARRPTRYQRRRPTRTLPKPRTPPKPEEPKEPVLTGRAVPVPKTSAPPVPSIEEIQQKISPFVKTPLQERTPTFLESLGQALFPSRGKPGLFMERAPLTQESLPVPFLMESGAMPSEFFGFAPPTSGRPSMGRDIFGAQEGRKRSHRTIASFISRGIRPPFISFNAQKFLRISNAEFEDMGYQLTPAGWVRLPVASATQPTGAGGGEAQGKPRLGGVRTYGGGSSSRRLSQTGLINWRI